MTANPALISTFLKTHWPDLILDIHFIGAGMFSHAYRFDTPQGRFVLRVGANQLAFQRDQYAARYFTKLHLPIPTVLALGRFDTQYYYAITPHYPGQNLDQLDEATLRHIFPHLAHTLHTLHQCDISSSSQTGFGPLNPDGTATFTSWLHYLLNLDPIAILAREDEILHDWDTLFATTFLDKSLFTDCYSTIKSLVSYCPSACWLIHGDFGFDNALSDGQTITGILDWAEMKVGDFLYDVAYLSF